MLLLRIISPPKTWLLKSPGTACFLEKKPASCKAFYRCRRCLQASEPDESFETLAALYNALSTLNNHDREVIILLESEDGIYRRGTSGIRYGCRSDQQ